jgi:hypothetical protein
MNFFLNTDVLKESKEFCEKLSNRYKKATFFSGMIRTTVIFGSLIFLTSTWSHLNFNAKFFSILVLALLSLLAVFLHEQLKKSSDIIKIKLQQLKEKEKRSQRTYLSQPALRVDSSLSDLEPEKYIKPLLGFFFLKSTKDFWISQLLLAGQNKISNDFRRTRIKRIELISALSGVCDQFETLAMKEFKHSKKSISNVQNTSKYRLIIGCLFFFIWSGALALIILGKTSGETQFLTLALKVFILYFVFLSLLQAIVPQFWILGDFHSEPHLIPMLHHSQNLLPHEKMKSLNLENLSSVNRSAKLFNLIGNLLSIRGNPIIWFLSNLFFSLDGLLLILIDFLNRSFKPIVEKTYENLKELDLCLGFARLLNEDSKAHLIQADLDVTDYVFECEELYHPGLKKEDRVSHSISLNQKERIVLLTGSNMAGKSTFLKSVGLNHLLFQLGSPVFAKRFVSSNFCVLSALQILDSLDEGLSFFYAEVKRLGSIDRIIRKEKKAVFFLIDEIFKGTNNEERYWGALSLLNSWSKYPNAFGILSTHDQELSKLETKTSVISNYHFEDQFNQDNQSLFFDYQLKKGPSTTTNAIHIMRSEGLDIPLINRDELDSLD